MTRKMLVDSSQSEETRVVVLEGNRLEEFDYDSEAKKQLKGNIYLAKVTRVEPSLQAAFVDYGGNRHGFLAFNEIHPDYYKIPVADREKLLAEEAAINAASEPDDLDQVDTVGGDEVEDVKNRRMTLRRRYKIQEVIKRGQVLLVQVVKEERGNKGAALTTYLSLPGRYCVLMPNTARGGGISRKITNAADRKRLKKILDELGIPEGMAVIVRTAGSERTKSEVKRDCDYLLRLWDKIRTDTLQSTAPALIYEEANLIKRAIRDLYTKDIGEVLVEGEEGYRAAKEFMRTLMPSHAKRVQPYKNDGIPLFQRFQVESQIDAIQNAEVKLRSGGYIVMHQTEALVAIDVNSGRSTRERHIEETALKTNLEAADEIARQLRLRDLAGLIVIDFIDMEDQRNNNAVERRLKEALRHDRARIQVGRISHFGLLEMSRQRLRPSLAEMSSIICPHCRGSGYIRSVEWTGLHVLRAVEEEAIKRRAGEISLSVPTTVALYILNHKRAKLSDLEQRYHLRIIVVADDGLVPPAFKIDITRAAAAPTEAPAEVPAPPAAAETAEDEQERPGKRRRRSRRRRRKHDEETVPVAAEAEAQAEAEETEEAPAEELVAAESEQDGSGSGRQRKRGRRGGRRRRRTREDQPAVAAAEATEAVAESEAEGAVEAAVAAAEEPAPVAAEPAGDNGTSTERQPDEPPMAAETRREAEPEPAAAAAEESESRETVATPEPDTRPGEAGPETDREPETSREGPPPYEPEEPREKRTGWWNRVIG